MDKIVTSSVEDGLVMGGKTTLTTFDAMANGAVIIGNKAFDLAYANNPANVEEISSEIVAGGAVYVKDFEGNCIDNVTGEIVTASFIPDIVYKCA